MQVLERSPRQIESLHSRQWMSWWRCLSKFGCQANAEHVRFLYDEVNVLVFRNGSVRVDEIVKSSQVLFSTTIQWCMK